MNKRQKHTIESMRAEATRRGWQLLDSRYTRGNDYYTFICENGHTIKKTGENFIRKSPCRVCSGKDALTIEIFRQEASKRNWKLLTTVYSGKTQILNFQCLKCNTKFPLKSSAVRGKKATKNCPNCSPTKRLTIDSFKDRLKKHGISLLSDQYFSIESKYEFKCKYNHTWEARANDVLNNESGCPHCRHYKMEEKVRYLLEKYFKTKFKKTKILNGKLEFDGYSENLNLAFEYNGEQHYKRINYYQKTNQEFLELQNRDRQKLSYCIANKIDLIIIPYTEKSNKKMVDFLANNLPSHLSVDKSKMFKILSNYVLDPSLLLNIKQLLDKVGMDLISDGYTNATETDLRIKCRKCGYEKNTSKNKIERGNGCYKCSGRMAYTLEELQDIAKERVGKLISKTYTPGKKVTWECAKGHQWDAFPNSVKSYNRKGTWCQECAHNKTGSFEMVQQLAFLRGHKVKAAPYVNRESKFTFTCPVGSDHVWVTTFNSYKKSRGSGCRMCAKK
jgi:predicted Zn-ribbon and HTH transcriptional regulator